jgi:hypothetical protein
MSLTSSSRKNPCPICGRTKDGDCRINDDEVNCHRGATHHPPEGVESGNVVKGLDGQNWAYTGESEDHR